jgi:hypothetical protein
MGRGPSYPYVGLEEAIALTQKMYDYTKRAAAPVDSVITEAWKYSPTSSSGVKVLAALKAFGLVEDAAATSGKAALKLTPRSIRILLDDQDTPLRREEIRKAALSPKWYDYCWKTWGKEMPPSMKSNLLIEHGFVDSTVESFLKDYRKTMAFAGLLDSKIGLEDEESNTGPQVGDWVQCDMKGQLRLPKPAKLIRIEDHAQHGKFGFVEGQKGGIEYEHLVKVEPPTQDSKPALQSSFFSSPPASNVTAATLPPSKGEIKTKMETESFTLSNGLVAQFQWPNVMSEAAFKKFEYFLEGVKMSVKEAVSGLPSGVESKDEEAAKEEAEERMERSS